jgi:hypothetical protein
LEDVTFVFAVVVVAALVPNGSKTRTTYSSKGWKGTPSDERRLNGKIKETGS